MGEGSGWIMNLITSIHLNIAKYRPIRGSSYIASPSKIELKKCVINKKNEEDNNCFIYAMLTAKYKEKNHKHLPQTWKKYMNEFNLKNIEMPMAINNLDKFEKQNPDYIVKVYGCDENGENIYQRRIIKRRDREPTNLLLLQNEETYHYVLITEFDRLLGSGNEMQKKFCP